MTLQPPGFSIETDNDSKRASNRTSQIIHHSGFLNQHPLPSAAGALSLSKGWTPRKAVLKGTKLFFFKAPKDRVNEIKLLFPSGIVESQTSLLSTHTPAPPLTPYLRQPIPPAPLMNGTESDAPVARRRAYWGRERHPELVVSHDEQRVVKGTPDALLHEVVFGTVFDSPKSSQSEEYTSDSDSLLQSDDEDARAHWISFATSLIVCLPHPSFMGRQKFETELLRRLSHLLSIEAVGAHEKDAEGVVHASKLQERARWLLQCYVSHWGDVVDREAWATWQADNLNGDTNPTEGECDATQGSSSRPTTPHSSSHFPVDPSPPTASGLTSSSSQNPSSPSKSDKGRNNKSKARSEAKLSALLKDGFTGEIFTWLDFDKIAFSLGVWHSARARILVSLLSSISVGEILDAAQSMKQGPSSVTTSKRGASKSAAILIPPEGGNGLLECFCGSDVRPHWLTRLILSQLLGIVNGSTTSVGQMSPISAAVPASVTENLKASGAGMNDKRSLTQLSRTHSRAEILGRWIAVGETARIAGDECTFMAVQSAVCSKAIARLDKVWRRVAHRERKVVESWVSGECEFSIWFHQRCGQGHASVLVRRFSTDSSIQLRQRAKPTRPIGLAILSIELEILFQEHKVWQMRKADGLWNPSPTPRSIWKPS